MEVSAAIMASVARLPLVKVQAVAGAAVLAFLYMTLAFSPPDFGATMTFHRAAMTQLEKVPDPSTLVISRVSWVSLRLTTVPSMNTWPALVGPGARRTCWPKYSGRAAPVMVRVFAPVLMSALPVAVQSSSHTAPA